MKRAAIYVFYDKDGYVDRYVEYYLNDLVKNVDLLVVVCNGKISAEGRRVLKQYSDHVFARENKGFDIAAYRAGMQYIGWDKLQDYDELILANDTVYGPIYPFHEMFDEMDKRELDFWGITRHYKVKANPYNCEYGYIPEHIQSYFMAFRKSLLGCYEFIRYWKNLPSIKTYKDAVGKHECRFTKYFSDMGFKWDTYIDTDDLKDGNPQPNIVYAKELIKNRRNPICKRRLFFQDYDWMLANTVGQSAIDAFEYIHDYTTYDTDMIMENLLRVYNQSDIAECLHFNYILPSDMSDEAAAESVIKKKKVALVMHIHYPDQLNMDIRYVSAMPESADVYLVTNSEEKKEAIEQAFSEMSFHHFEIRVTQNRGRDIGSLIVGVKDVIDNYEYVCFVHDKKTSQLNPGSVGEAFAYKCLENTLYNQNYVYNIINTFERNPKLGLMSPPGPNHADFFSSLGNEWGNEKNFKYVTELKAELGLHVDINEDKSHLSPLGDYFWFRVKAFKPLFAKNWEYEDLPEEPIGVDGTLLHALERIHSFVAQEMGYYSAHVMVDRFARIEITNMQHYLRGVNTALYKKAGVRTDALGVYNYISELGKLQKEFDHAIEIIHYNEKVMKERAEIIDQLHNSTSWKITAPIRMVKSLLTGK